MYFTRLFVFACLSTCHGLVDKDDSQDHCELLRQWLESSSVSVELSKSGFHRDVITTVGLRSPDAFSDIRVLLVHKWPRGVYVDPYQLASLSGPREWEILLDSTIDLEVPAHKASGFVTYVYVSHDGQPSRFLKVIIPVHGRYHEPSFVGETFTSVDIQVPALLLRTDQCTQLNSLEPHLVVDAPCTVNNSSTCKWIQIQHEQNGPVRLQLPVGDGSLVVPICGGTLLMTMICCVTLSKYMWKNRMI